MCFFFFKQKTAYEMRISDWSSDVCSSDFARGAGLAQYLDARGLKVLKALDRVASEYDTSPTAVALAWLMSQPAITAPIVSASSVDQLGELIKAAHLTLGSEAMQLLDDASRSEERRVGKECVSTCRSRS